MNERIKELARQAYVKDSLEHDPDWKQTEVYNCLMNELDGFFEKFAELIVRECMNICKQHPSRILSNRWDADAVTPDILHRFEEHFGVEE